MDEAKEKFIIKLSAELSEISLQLSEAQIEMFYQYYELLIKWNKVMNLTAITEPDDVITKHFVDSLSLNKAVEDLSDCCYHIIDVGTGAGFPGIPLKIAYPNLKITLLDSLNKRVKFLNEVIEHIHLSGIGAVHGRAEDYGKDKKYREQYDYCVSRAVANLSTLSEYCLPFVKVNGYFIPYKSGKIEEEVNSARMAVHMLGGQIENICAFSLSNGDVDRSLVKIKKIREIGKQYPRKAGLPAKEPLC